MKIALAQIECTPGEVEINYKQHLFWIEEAAKQSVDLICFPELSLTGYAPSLCGNLQMDGTEEYWIRLQELADLNRCIICVGYSAKGNHMPQIALRIISPEKEPRVYAKHLLHSDEKSYFEEGNSIADIHLDGKRIALAICYEAMQESHLKHFPARCERLSRFCC